MIPLLIASLERGAMEATVCTAQLPSRCLFAPKAVSLRDREPAIGMELRAVGRRRL